MCIVLYYSLLSRRRLGLEKLTHFLFLCLFLFKLVCLLELDFE